jgi:hypothetical protein
VKLAFKDHEVIQLSVSERGVHNYVVDELHVGESKLSEY